VATASENSTIESEAALAISLSDAMDPALPGENLVYTITYSNPGNDTTTDVVITTAIDPLLTLVSAVPPPDLGTTNRWTIGTLAGGTSATIDVTVAIPPAANGTLLTNQVTITDVLNRSATATETTTVSSPAFSIDVTDSADPVVSEQEVEFSISYANILGLLQPGVTIRTTYDPRFVMDQAVPAPDPGSTNLWSLGTLLAGQAGSIVVRGRFITLFDAAPARTDVQIANGSAAAFASQLTAVQPLPALSRHSVKLKRSSNKDRWRVGARFTTPGGVDPTGEPFSLSILTPGGEGHITDLTVPVLERTPRGRWRFRGNIPGEGDVLIRIRSRGGNEQWKLNAQARGPNILPLFPADRTFQIVIHIGSKAFLSDYGQLRESGSGTS
jgi:uncharacterized repeat protein (TIGR01451 family)